MTKPKQPTYLDPRDEYVRSPDGITLDALTEKWHREHGDGYSTSWLRKRSAREGWQKERLAYWERARNITATKELDKTADEHARIIERYTRLLDGVVAGSVRYLQQFQPPEGATPEERAEFVPPFKGPGEASKVLMLAVELDRKVRGLDVQKFQDVTDEEDSTDAYAHLTDDQLETLANEEDDDAGGGEA